MVNVGNEIALRVVRENLADVLEIDVGQVGPRMSLHEEFEIDSLQKTEFLARLERYFGMVLRPEDVAALDNVDDIVRALAERGAIGDG